MRIEKVYIVSLIVCFVTIIAVATTFVAQIIVASQVIINHSTDTTWFDRLFLWLSTHMGLILICFLISGLTCFFSRLMLELRDNCVNVVKSYKAQIKSRDRAEKTKEDMHIYS